MDEGTLQVEHEGQTYHARWILDDTGVVQVWVGDRGPFSTIVDAPGIPGTTPPGLSARTLALMMVKEFLVGRASSGG
jgi:hypothetical protein